jgi:hypothetical protein
VVSTSGARSALAWTARTATASCTLLAPAAAWPTSAALTSFGASTAAGGPAFTAGFPATASASRTAASIPFSSASRPITAAGAPIRTRRPVSTLRRGRGLPAITGGGLRGFARVRRRLSDEDEQHDSDRNQRKCRSHVASIGLYSQNPSFSSVSQFSQNRALARLLGAVYTQNSWRSTVACQGQETRKRLML